MTSEVPKPVCAHGHAYGLHPADEPPDCDTFATVAEHKAEAVAAALAGVRRRVEGLSAWSVEDWVVDGSDVIHVDLEAVDRAAVFAIVNEEADR